MSSEITYLLVVKTVGPEPSITDTTNEGVLMFASNYTRVTKISSSLYVYSLRCSRSKLDGDGRVYFDKRPDNEEAYLTAKNNPADPLNLKGNNVLYATNFKELWLSISIGTEPNRPWVSKNFEYRQMNGRTANNLRIEFVFVKGLTNIQENLQSGKLGQIQEYIHALNACVSEAIHERFYGKDKIIQPSNSKIFIKHGYKSLCRVRSVNDVRAVRGYFTSIRPGSNSILLNINSTTSAFLPPSPLPCFIENSSWFAQPFSVCRAVGSYKKKLLKGSSLRICYERGPYDNGVNYNTEQKRTVQFQQFGRLAKDQKSWHLLSQSQTGEARRIDFDRPAQTVEEYFSSSKSLAFSYVCWNSTLILFS